MLELTSIATLLDSSWMIPAAPLLGALVIVTLLVSFARTMNRLTKPISLILVSCVAFSIILSILFLLNHVSGQSFYMGFDITDMSFSINFYVNDLVEKALIVIGSIFLLIMIFSYYLLDRQKGYVRYMAGLSILCSLIYAFTLNSNSFRFFVQKFPV